MSDFNFIDAFIDFYRERESPEIFWRWGAIGCLAGVLRDNIYLQFHNEFYYPNMFIVLLADSAEYRKAAACKAASKYIKAVGNTKFVGGRLSMQQFLRELAQDYTNDNGKMIRGASGVLYSEELSVLLVKDPATVPILIEIYDYHDEWTNTLVSTGKFKLKDTCISLVAASNSSMFSRIDTSSEDGLLGRIFIIKADGTQKRPRKSLFDLAATNDTRNDDALVQHLKNIAKLKGPVIIEAEAHNYHNDWYYSIPDEIFSDKIGFGGRMGTHVVKIALCVAAARGDFDKTINVSDIKMSIDLCNSIRKNYRQIAISTGLSTRSAQVGVIIKILINEPGYKVKRSDMIRKTLGDIEGEVLDSILTYMAAADLMRETTVKGSPGYALTQKTIKSLIEGD
jgi:hypothetical protein